MCRRRALVSEREEGEGGGYIGPCGVNSQSAVVMARQRSLLVLVFAPLVLAASASAGESSQGTSLHQRRESPQKKN